MCQACSRLWEYSNEQKKQKSILSWSKHPSREVPQTKQYIIECVRKWYVLWRKIRQGRG